MRQLRPTRPSLIPSVAVIPLEAQMEVRIGRDPVPSEGEQLLTAQMARPTGPDLIPSVAVIPLEAQMARLAEHGVIHLAAE